MSEATKAKEMDMLNGKLAGKLIYTRERKA